MGNLIPFRRQELGWRAVAQQLGVGVGTLYRVAPGCSKILEKVWNAVGGSRARYLGSPSSTTAITIEKIENRRKHERYHATVVGVNFEIFQIKSVSDHPIPHQIAALH